MRRLILALLMMFAVAGRAWGDALSFVYEQPPTTQPVLASMVPSDDEGVYTLPQPAGPGEGVNQGGVHVDVSAGYFNHYVYRGVDHSIGLSDKVGTFNTKASTFNFQIDSKLQFDLGKFPHPFVGLFADVYDADPVNRFQEVRPYYGAVWTVKPFTLEGGGNTYIYPDRENLNTAEYYTKLTLNDAFLFHSDKPLLSPYIYSAYDYDKNHGWYFEAGVSHDLALEDFGLTFTFKADVAYIVGYQQQFVFIDENHDTGFQHYDVGLLTAYSLNHLFNLNQRFGQFDLLGYITYTGKIEAELRANNVIWGGAGIRFMY